MPAGLAEAADPGRDARCRSRPEPVSQAGGRGAQDHAPASTGRGGDGADRGGHPRDRGGRLAVAARGLPETRKTQAPAEPPRAVRETPAPDLPEPVRSTKPLTLTGRVVDEQGKPVPGADVRLRLLAAPDPPAAPDLVGDRRRLGGADRRRGELPDRGRPGIRGGRFAPPGDRRERPGFRRVRQHPVLGPGPGGREAGAAPRGAIEARRRRHRAARRARRRPPCRGRRSAPPTRRSR